LQWFDWRIATGGLMIAENVCEDSITLEVNGRRARSASHEQQTSQDARIASVISEILLDVSVLYFKTSRSLRHIVGPNVRNYRLLLDEQRAQLSAMIDQITERNRKMGVTVHKSVYQMTHQQSARDKDAAYIQPLDILDDLHEDNQGLLACLKEACGLCNGYLDIETASLIGIWIDETARRSWSFSQAID
jgi:starvation-inducible DNA-binding protein